MKQNTSLIIDVAANGFLVTTDYPRFADGPNKQTALVFETKAGLLKYVDEHFSATKKPTVETN